MTCRPLIRGIMAETRCFWIYILECSNQHFYTGYSTNLVKRFRQHLSGTAHSRYTQSHPPVRIAQCWRFEGTVGTALKIERLIKSLNRASKETLVQQPNQLQPLIARRLNLDVDILAVDPQQVEHTARFTDCEDWEPQTDADQNAPVDQNTQ